MKCFRYSMSRSSGSGLIPCGNDATLVVRQEWRAFFVPVCAGCVHQTDTDHVPMPDGLDVLHAQEVLAL